MSVNVVQDLLNPGQPELGIFRREGVYAFAEFQSVKTDGPMKIQGKVASSSIWRPHYSVRRSVENDLLWHTLALYLHYGIRRGDRGRNNGFICGRKFEASYVAQEMGVEIQDLSRGRLQALVIVQGRKS